MHHIIFIDTLEGCDVYYEKSNFSVKPVLLPSIVISSRLRILYFCNCKSEIFLYCLSALLIR